MISGVYSENEAQYRAYQHHTLNPEIHNTGAFRQQLSDSCQ
jgi:hypothetical protein